MESYFKKKLKHIIINLPLIDKVHLVSCLWPIKMKRSYILKLEDINF